MYRCVEACGNDAPLSNSRRSQVICKTGVWVLELFCTCHVVMLFSYLQLCSVGDLASPGRGALTMGM